MKKERLLEITVNLFNSSFFPYLLSYDFIFASI